MENVQNKVFILHFTLCINFVLNETLTMCHAHFCSSKCSVSVFDCECSSVNSFGYSSGNMHVKSTSKDTKRNKMLQAAKQAKEKVETKSELKLSSSSFAFRLKCNR